MNLDSKKLHSTDQTENIAVNEALKKQGKSKFYKNYL